MIPGVSGRDRGHRPSAGLWDDAVEDTVAGKSMGTSNLDLNDPLVVGFWLERHLCTVSLVRGDGRLHVTPMGIALEPEEGRAWGITDGNSMKSKLLRSGGPIAVCQVDRARWSTIYGTATVETDAAAIQSAERHYASRYRVPRTNPHRVAIKIAIARVSGRL